MPRTKRQRCGNPGGVGDRDIDEAGVTRDASQSCRQSNLFAEGPTSLNDVIGAPWQQLLHFKQQCLLSGHADRIACLRALFVVGMVLTSCYTGIGTFECMAAWYSNVAAKVFELTEDEYKPFVCWSATDIGSLQQKCIAAHPQASRPRHRFSDVFDRLLPCDRDVLSSIENDVLRRSEEDKQKHEDGMLTKCGLLKRQNKLGEELLDRLCSHLEGCEFAETSWCSECNQQCNYSPRFDASLSSSFWCEAGGHNCFPFSKMNQKQSQWLDASTLLLLTWIYSLRFFEPDLILTECVPGFRPGPILNILGKQNGVMKSTALRPDQHTPHYASAHRSFGLRAIGLPGNRERLYGAYVLVPRHSTVELWDSGFEELFHRGVAVDAGIYLCDTAGSSIGAEEDSFEITSAKDAVLEGYQWKAIDDGLRVDGRWTVSTALVNLSNVGSYAHVYSECFPTLLKSSKLYDMVRDRTVGMAELWLAHGFPHPSIAGVSEHHAYFPCSRLVDPANAECLTVASQRNLLGNSMHVAQMGAWFLYVLSGIKYSSCEDAA